MPSTGNKGHPGQGDIRENAADLEHQLHCLKGDYELCIASMRGDIPTPANQEQFVDIWAHTRKLETRFHWMQGDYHVRISSMQAVTARCKRHMQISSFSRSSGANTGGSLPAPRY